MCREMEKIYNEGIEIGIERGVARGVEQGEWKKAREAALSMAADGMQAEKIAYFLHVDTAIVQKWMKETSQEHRR